MELSQRLLRFVGAGALAAGVFVGCNSANEVTDPNLEVKITSLQNGDIIRSTIDVSGTVNMDLPKGDDIWVVVRGEGDSHMHPQREPTHPLDDPPRHWLLTGATVGYSGNEGQDLRAYIYAVVTTSDATSNLRSYLTSGAINNSFPGLLQLPYGSNIKDQKLATRLANT